MQHENQNVKGEITVRQRLKQLLQSPPSFLWQSSLSTQQLIRVDSDPVVSSTDHVRQWKPPDTSRHIPTFHGGQSCPSPVAEALNEKTPKADAAVVVRGIGIIPVRIPINQVAAQKDRSRFSTMRHPWFLSHAKDDNSQNSEVYIQHVGACELYSWELQMLQGPRVIKK